MSPSARKATRRRWVWVLVAVLLAALAVDLRREPARQLSARALVSGIRLYRGSLSSHLGATCRFRPTCSRYAEAVILRYGAAVGSWLAVRRLARCGPWTASDTVDPPPAHRDPSTRRL